MVMPIDIISRALKDIGALEAGETPTPDAAQDAFDMLNDMIDQWSNESMMVYYKNEIIFPIVPGQTQYTIGPTGEIGANFTGYISGNTLTVANTNVNNFAGTGSINSSTLTICRFLAVLCRLAASSQEIQFLAARLSCRLALELAVLELTQSANRFLSTKNQLQLTHRLLLAAQSATGSI